MPLPSMLDELEAKAEQARTDLRKELAANLREKKVPLFSTEKSVEAVIEKLGLKGEVVVAVMILTNTLLEIIAKEIEDGNLSK